MQVMVVESFTYLHINRGFGSYIYLHVGKICQELHNRNNGYMIFYKLQVRMFWRWIALPLCKGGHKLSDVAAEKDFQGMYLFS